MRALSSAVPMPLGAVHRAPAGSPGSDPRPGHQEEFAWTAWWLPSTMSAAVLYLPDNKLGFKLKSIVPAHAQMAAESLIPSLKDKGRLGTLTRPL